MRIVTTTRALARAESAATTADDSLLLLLLLLTCCCCWPAVLLQCCAAAAAAAAAQTACMACRRAALLCRLLLNAEPSTADAGLRPQSSPMPRAVSACDDAKRRASAKGQAGAACAGAMRNESKSCSGGGGRHTKDDTKVEGVEREDSEP